MICIACGNQNSFTQKVSGTQYVGGTRTIDGETESEVDLNITNEDDIDWNDESNYECEDCGSEDVKDGLERREIKHIVWEHTEKDGTWSEDEIDEEDRDTDLGDELLVGDM